MIARNMSPSTSDLGEATQDFTNSSSLAFTNPSYPYPGYLGPSGVRAPTSYTSKSSPDLLPHQNELCVLYEADEHRRLIHSIHRVAQPTHTAHPWLIFYHNGDLLPGAYFRREREKWVWILPQGISLFIFFINFGLGEHGYEDVPTGSLAVFSPSRKRSSTILAYSIW